MLIAPDCPRTVTPGPMVRVVPVDPNSALPALGPNTTVPVPSSVCAPVPNCTDVKNVVPVGSPSCSVELSVSPSWTTNVAVPEVGLGIVRVPSRVTPRRVPPRADAVRTPDPLVRTWP